MITTKALYVRSSESKRANVNDVAMVRELLNPEAMVKDYRRKLGSGSVSAVSGD
jgi:hypothetical protein